MAKATSARTFASPARHRCAAHPCVPMLTDASCFTTLQRSIAHAIYSRMCSVSIERLLSSRMRLEPAALLLAAPKMHSHNDDSSTMSRRLVQVWVHGLMATMHAYLGEINEHIALQDVRMQIPL